MSDPIGAAALRNIQSLQIGGDEARRYRIDIGKGENGSFAEALTQAVNHVSDVQDDASEMVQRYLRGEHVELHQVMAASEEAGIALELLIEVRNKVLDAYRTLSTMQS